MVLFVILKINRCKRFDAEDAIVFVSKSIDCEKVPPKDGVIRVDNYWCHSAYLSIPKQSPNGNVTPMIASLDKPGMKFVTIFCDDAKVPLPRQVVDMIAKHAEKMVPTSIEKLHLVAKDAEVITGNGNDRKIIFKRNGNRK